MPDLFIGLLSGTSMDGIDAALVRFSPQPQLVASHSLAFSADLRAELLALCVPGANEIDRLGRADVELGRCFGRAVRELLVEARVDPREVRAIGSHGQTIRHRPDFSPAFTLQIGDPSVIASETGLPVVADFRRKDMALGGQGAPLVPAFHQAVFRSAENPRVIVNIGGIANVTVLPSESGQPLLGFDTGPGNTLLDAWARRVLGTPMDLDGALAARGQVVPGLLARFRADAYFGKAPPKSTGPEYFSMKWLEQHLAAQGGANDADVQATLLMLTASTIIDGIKDHADLRGLEIFVCGGGAHNATLMRALQTCAGDVRVSRTDELGVPVAWVEAMAFAWLARERLENRPGNCPSVTGARRLGILGGVFLPN